MSRRTGRPPRRGGSWSIVCDFDGTISREDVTDSLLVRFARRGWLDLESEWEAGRIGSRACMAGQVALLDCTSEELDAHIAGLAIDPDFRSFVDAVNAEGASLTITSDGMDYVILAMLGRAGLAHLPVCASRLVQRGERQWALEFPHATASCIARSATCKCACVRADTARPALLIGDGASDFCAARRAELTFAKSRLVDHCIVHRLPHRAFIDFSDALLAWRELADDFKDTPMPSEMA